MKTIIREGSEPPSAAMTVVAAKKKAARPSNLFPRNTLEDALKVAEAIEAKNAGQPISPTDLAIAMSRSPGSSAHQIVLSSSLKYGLTAGNYKSDRIALTPLGQLIVSPTSAEERAQAVVEAALRPETFTRAYEYFKAKKLDTQFLPNIFVREFGIPTELAKECAETFTANLRVAGLLRQAPTGMWVASDATHAKPVETTAAIESETIVDAADVDDAENGSLGAMVPDVPNMTPPAPSVGDGPHRPNAIFIGHGKDKGPLSDLTKLLDEYKLPYKVAQYEANAGRPIPTKVAEVMKQCGAAILLFTPDEQLRDLDGNAVWRPSQNVGHELGAASMLYDNRIVIFKERSVTLPSNYSSIGWIEFDKQDLTAKAVELFRELIAFGLVRITVGS